MSSEVCTVARVSFSLFAPTQRATSTFTPVPTPIRKPVNSVTRMVVEPTAPSAAEPANRPTTAMSDMLNSTCSTFEIISGRLKKRICFPRRPCVKSCFSRFIGFILH